MTKENEADKEEASTGVVLERIVMPHFRIILTKIDTCEYWSVCGNPSWGYFEKLCSDVLQNHANDYIEYRNCAVQHRMIRFEDINKYFDKIDIPFEWALDPQSA